ncbi:MAG: TonB-dependent receptor, partial [Porticoccaceae bacterium]|nr:TonB-dependent receptor [Porticoccaceae bacterium]
MMSSKLKTSIQAVNRAIAFCGVAGAVALAGAVPLAQAAEGDKEREIQEVIVVKGVKGSLQRALQIKRNASSIVDAISAEDIGDFPDENIAESLQRISGVTIERERGEGSRISIRGLGPNFNLTLLNEQRIASSNLFEDEQPSRGFNYSLLASEVIASAEVYKSPEAWFDEGGVGGTVILRTRKPLDLDKPLLSIRLEGGYSDLADEYDPRFSFTAGSKFGNDKWGFLISGVKTERTVRNDATGPLSFSQRPVDLNSDGVLDFGTVPAGTPDPSRGFGDDPNATATVTGINAVDANGNPVIQGIQSAEGLFQPDLLGNTFFVSVRERTGASGALQFQPNEQLQFSLTGLYSELTDNGVNNNLLLLPTRLAGTLGAVVTPVNNASIVGNTLVAGTIPQRITNLGNFTGNRGNVITTALDSFDRDAQIDTFAIDLETEWQDASETWKVVSHIGVTEATTDSTNRFLETVTFGEQTFDLRVGENGSQSVPQDLTNPAGQPFGFASFQTLEQENEQAYASIDITYTLDSENIDSIRFGAKYRTQSQNRVRVLSQATNSTSDGGSVFALGLSSFNPMPTPDDFLSGGFEDGINAFQFSDPAFVDDILSGDFGDESVFVRQPNNEDFFDIEEDITSLFGQVNFSTSEKWRGNAGIRVIRIERDSLANELFQGTVTPFEQRSTQTEVLPSFNLIYDVNENFVTRFALSRTLALPT